MKMTRGSLRGNNSSMVVRGDSYSTSQSLMFVERHKRIIIDLSLCFIIALMQADGQRNGSLRNGNRSITRYAVNTLKDTFLFPIGGKLRPKSFDGFLKMF